MKVLPAFRVVIPEEIHQGMRLQAGMRLAVIQYDRRIELAPLRPTKSLRGHFADIEDVWHVPKRAAPAG